MGFVGQPRAILPESFAMFPFLERFARDRFAKMLQRRIAAAGGPTDFKYDREKFVLTGSNGTAFLGNVYAQWRQEGSAHKQRLVDNFVATFSTTTNAVDLSWTEVQGKLTAAVRERAMLAAMDGPGWGLGIAAKPEKRPAQEPLSTWFSRTVLVDYPTHVVTVNQEHLADWGITFEEAFKIGLERLRSATVAKFDHVDGYYVGTWKDDYDASRILLPAIFEDLPLDGAPIVCLPNRLTLLVAGENQFDAVNAMLAKAEEVVRTIAKPQNPGPLVVREGKVLDFEVAKDSPMFNAVERARKFAALHTYQDQKTNLDRFYKETGKNFVVARYKLHELKSGGYESHCIWTKDVPTLLPVADYVVFVVGDGRDPKTAKIVAKVAWNDVVGKLGALLLDTQMFPARYYVSQFPTQEQ